MAASMTAQQSALLEQQKIFNMQVQTFETKQLLESAKEKANQTHVDAKLAVVAGMSGR